VGPECRKNHSIAGDGFQLKSLSMKAGFSAVLDGIQVNHHRQLSLPGSGADGIEVPFEMTLIFSVVLRVGRGQ
jgi:hypothetical protein